MERDFLGLSDKQYLSNVKREADGDRVGEGGLCSCLYATCRLQKKIVKVVY